jgi:MoaA/NifB/PqqE/SkfB family radical SAM enzyme
MRKTTLPLRLDNPPPPVFVRTSDPAAFAEGFHDEEWAEGHPFRWMSRRARLRFPPSAERRHLELRVHGHFHDLSQGLAVGGEVREEHALIHGWNLLSVPVAPGTEAVDLETGAVLPEAYHPDDHRELALQIRPARVHADPERHRHVAAQHANAVRNVREMLEGRAELRSTPRTLGIDIQGACNVKPPCVYCAWDTNKALEGDSVEVPFTPGTLAEYGAFFDNVSQLVNCSIGEPFMTRDLDALLDVFGDRGKVLEMTTNGQILTGTNIGRLLGREVHLYVSLDAATPQTYARLRNDTFDRVVDNVRRLVQAKGGRGRLPHVYLVFMPMRANVHELDAFVGLCAELGVDKMVLRPLNDSEGVALVWDRGGYHFDYQEELLPFDERIRASGRAAELCRRLGVELADQMDFGGSISEQFAEGFAAGRRDADAVSPAPAAVASSPAEPAAVDVDAGPRSPPLRRPPARRSARARCPRAPSRGPACTS